jgi:aryl-alcohol dehydrogenase-like predicted oxidoreductase
VKLALGTVQFGLEYGIANDSGRVSLDTARAIVAQASAAGMDVLDTAVGYGDSEARLGEIGVADWRIVSKIPAVPAECRDVAAWVRASVQQSLARLRVDGLYGLLLHRPGQLLEPVGPALYGALRQLVADGVVRKIGVSVYDPAECDALCAAYRFDLIQAPYNLLDRRLETGGWLERFTAQGTEVHVRSIFLQGLLLMTARSRPAAFRRWQPVWAALDRWVGEAAVTPLEACVRHALSTPQVSQVVVGVDSAAQLSAILRAAGGPALPTVPMFGAADPDLINPARWTRCA